MCTIGNYIWDSSKGYCFCSAHTVRDVRFYSAFVEYNITKAISKHFVSEASEIVRDLLR